MGTNIRLYFLTNPFSGYYNFWIIRWRWDVRMVLYL